MRAMTHGTGTYKYSCSRKERGRWGNQTANVTSLPGAMPGRLFCFWSETGMNRPVDLDLLGRTVDEAFTLDELRARLAEGRPLRIKYGVDVTAPFLHIGHAVNLWLMRHLQDAGHKVLFLIGDFTTRIGDPTGKNHARREIPRDEIEANAQEFIRQVALVLRTDPEVFEVRRNSEWYEKMTLDGFMSLLAMVTHARLIQRDMFQRRLQNGMDIHMHEMLYPVLQGYDSVMLESDLTIVGSDQLFNELMGRFYRSASAGSRRS